MHQNTFCVDDFLRPFVNDAVARLNYLFPGVRFQVVEGAILMQSDHPLENDILSKEISYALYRAKIRNEGLANRSALYAAVFG